MCIPSFFIVRNKKVSLQNCKINWLSGTLYLYSYTNAFLTVFYLPINIFQSNNYVFWVIWASQSCTVSHFGKLVNASHCLGRIVLHYHLLDDKLKVIMAVMKLCAIWYGAIEEALSQLQMLMIVLICQDVWAWLVKVCFCAIFPSSKYVQQKDCSFCSKRVDGVEGKSGMEQFVFEFILSVQQYQ